MQVPAQMPEGEFDLIVVSEVAYYWQLPDLERAATGLAQRHATGGHLWSSFTLPSPSPITPSAATPFTTTGCQDRNGGVSTMSAIIASGLTFWNG